MGAAMRGGSLKDADAIDACLARARSRSGPCVVLTGAGISAESGVPTFRGKDGYWRVGSRNYHARELATRVRFDHMPFEVWRWYLERRRICRGAAPNVAHQALAAAASELGERLLLVTQNVDGLHRRAGSPARYLYEIHGNIDYMRCSAGCGGIRPLPDAVALDAPSVASLEPLAPLLSCAACGALCRPHVLSFDEYYDEEHFRFESSLRAAANAALLVVVGTTATTNLPVQMGELAARGNTPIIVIDPEPNSFAELTARIETGCFLRGLASTWVPHVMQRLVALFAAPA